MRSISSQQGVAGPKGDTGATGPAASPGGLDTNIQFNNTAAFDGSTNLLWDYTNNRMGIRQATPTSYLHLGAGSTGAGASPFKLTTGSILTSPEAGAIEYDGVNLFSTTDTPARLVVMRALTANLLARSATVASVLAVTSPNDGSSHQFTVSGYVSITAVSADTLVCSVGFTDENGTSRTVNFIPPGAANGTLSTTGFSSFPAVTIRAKDNTAITIAATVSGAGSITYDVGASVCQID